MPGLRHTHATPSPFVSFRDELLDEMHDGVILDNCGPLFLLRDEETGGEVLRFAHEFEQA